MTLYNLSGKRRDAGIRQVTERDIVALTWIAEQSCITIEQLQRLLGRSPKAITKTPDLLSISATRHAVDRWFHLNLIDPPRKILAMHAPFLWVSRRGLVHLDLPYPYYQPKPSTVQHVSHLNTIRLSLERAHIPVVWYSHRALLRTRSQPPVPDAELHTGKAIVALQAVERSPLHTWTFREEIDTLQRLASRKYHSLWYFLHQEAHPLFQQALLTLGYELQQRVRVYSLDTQEEEARAHLDTLAQQPPI